MAHGDREQGKTTAQAFNGFLLRYGFFSLSAFNKFRFVVPFVLIGIPLLMSGRFTAKPTWNAAELARVGGVQAIGTIIDLLMSPGVEVSRPSLVEALTILLPQRRNGDGHPLNGVQSAFLIRFLQIQFSGGVSLKQWNSYRIASLKAMEQVGRAGAIPHVERLADMKLSNPDDARVKQAAKRQLHTNCCAPPIQSRLPLLLHKNAQFVMQVTRRKNMISRIG